MSYIALSGLVVNDIRTQGVALGYHSIAPLGRQSIRARGTPARHGQSRSRVQGVRNANQSAQRRGSMRAKQIRHARHDIVLLSWRIPVHPRQRRILSQPRATPWVQMSSRMSPERATQTGNAPLAQTNGDTLPVRARKGRPCLISPFQGSSLMTLEPRALP